MTARALLARLLSVEARRSTRVSLMIRAVPESGGHRAGCFPSYIGLVNRTCIICGEGLSKFESPFLSGTCCMETTSGQLSI